MKLFLIKWLATPVASIIIAYITAKLTTKRELLNGIVQTTSRFGRTLQTFGLILRK